jgi:hypothetical protein
MIIKNWLFVIALIIHMINMLRLEFQFYGFCQVADIGQTRTSDRFQNGIGTTVRKYEVSKVHPTLIPHWLAAF